MTNDSSDDRFDFDTDDGRRLELHRMTWIRSRTGGKSEIRMQGGEVVTVSDDDVERILEAMGGDGKPAPSVDSARYTVEITTEHMELLGSIGAGLLTTILADDLEREGFGVCIGASTAPYMKDVQIEFQVGEQQPQLGLIAKVMGREAERVPYRIRMTPHNS